MKLNNTRYLGCITTLHYFTAYWNVQMLSYFIEAVLALFQVFYCAIVIFLHALYNYGRHINPSWFPGNCMLRIVCLTSPVVCQCAVTQLSIKTTNCHDRIEVLCQHNTPNRVQLYQPTCCSLLGVNFDSIICLNSDAQAHLI